MLRLVPGVAVYEENEAAWYTVVPVNARFSWQGWIYELQEGYVERMPDQAGLTNRGRLVIRLTAQKDSVSAAESEQQASTGDPANMRENTQENTQQEVELADASYFGDNRLYRRKKDSQDTWELLTDGGSGFGTEQTEDDEVGPKKIVIGKEKDVYKRQIVDSVAALVPKAEIDGDMGDSHVGLQARLMSQALRKLTAVISKSNCIVIFINQLREKVGVMFGNPEVTTGGRALKFYSSVRMDVRRIEALKQGGEMVGNRTRIKVVKNKVAPPFKEAERCV